MSLVSHFLCVNCVPIEYRYLQSLRFSKVWQKSKNIYFVKFASLANRQKRDSRQEIIHVDNVLFSLSFSAFLFCLSCSPCPIYSACPILHVPICLCLCACPIYPSCVACPILRVPPVMAVTAFMSWQSCVIILVLCVVSSSACPALPVLFCCSTLSVLFHFWWCRSGCPVLVVPFWLSFSGCPVLTVAVLSCRPVQAVLFWISRHGHPVLAVQF